MVEVDSSMRVVDWPIAGIGQDAWAPRIPIRIRRPVMDQGAGTRSCGRYEKALHPGNNAKTRRTSWGRDRGRQSPTKETISRCLAPPTRGQQQAARPLEGQPIAECTRTGRCWPLLDGQHENHQPGGNLLSGRTCVAPHQRVTALRMQAPSTLLAPAPPRQRRTAGKRPRSWLIARDSSLPRQARARLRGSQKSRRSRFQHLTSRESSPCLAVRCAGEENADVGQPTTAS